MRAFYDRFVVIAVIGCWVAMGTLASYAGESASKAAFRAGACAVDITPEKLPVVVSGGFLSRTADSITDRLYARCVVMDDGITRIAMVVVDTCVLPADLLDEAKRQAQQATGIPTDRILISATHTHSAPAAMGALGSDCDPDYPEFLLPRLVNAIECACGKLTPARAGWTAVEDYDHTHCRRWILRPDRMGTDPFGQRTVRAMMHPGYQSPNHVGPAGPVDPYLTLLSIQSRAGKPIALLANYSQHYYGGVKALSADYYGRFAKQIEQLIGGGNSDFVGIMSQGTSGDLHWMDYSQPAKPRDIDAYANEVADVAFRAYQTIKHQNDVPLAMRERRITLKRRAPDEVRLAWAQQILDSMPDPKPRDRVQVYAREQVYLHEEPVREMKLQTLRIGGLGITAIPCEVYGITGLKTKLQSPLWPTMNLELANGEEGYIPPPEQHALGGYTTWPARTAALEVQAEPKIVENLLEMLEEVSGKHRRPLTVGRGEYAERVLAAKPAAYWRFGEIAGRQADDAGSGNLGLYEDGVALYLDGPPSPAFWGTGQRSRAAHFAGGRMRADVPELSETYTVELWFWNGLPNDARAVTGYLFSRGVDGVKGAPGEHLGIGGTYQPDLTGKLLFYNGDQLKEVLGGSSVIEPRTWNHVALVRDGSSVAVYLNGSTSPDVLGQVTPGCSDDVKQVFLGGRSDNLFNFEGRIAEVAVYSRAMSPEEISQHYAAAQMP